MVMGEERKGELEVFATGLLWATIGLFIRLLNEEGASPEWIGFMRYFFAFAVMAAIVAGRGGLAAFRVGRRALGLYAVLGVVCHGLCNICYVLAIAMSGMAISAVLMTSAPIFTALFSAALFRERLSARKGVALAFNAVGCALAATGGHIDPAGLSLAGLLFGLGSGLCYGLTAVVGRYAGRADVFATSAYGYLFAALFMLPCMWLRGSGALWTFQAMGHGFLLAIIPTSLAYVLYYDGLQKIRELSRVPVLASVECVAAIALGVAVFHEALGPGNYVGAALVLLSLILMR